jgi:hypothetical protein
MDGINSETRKKEDRRRENSPASRIAASTRESPTCTTTDRTA